MFLVDYGFATVNTNKELVIDIEMMKRILNLGETCMSLDGSNNVRKRTFQSIEHPRLGKSRSCATQEQEMPAEPKGEALDWRR